MATSTVGEHISVALIPQVATELQRLHDRTTLSITDVTNRAITLYDFIDGQLRSGNDVLIRDKGTGRLRSVRLR